MPAFFIFNDQNYYIAGKSELWMNLLQDPLEHRLRLPASDSGMQRQLTAMQDSLRSAVAASVRLQELTRVQGRDFVRKLVRVNISISRPTSVTAPPASSGYCPSWATTSCATTGRSPSST
jgi:hypothetical protein